MSGDHNKRYDDNSDSRITKEYLKEILDLKLEPINKMLGIHDRTLFGDGSEGYQGLRVEVDRIKQRGVLVNFVLGGFSIPIFGYAAKKIIEFFRS